jgi:hypothetical protein
MVCNGLFHNVFAAGHSFTTIKLGMVDLIRGDFAAAAVMITFGTSNIHSFKQLSNKCQTQVSKHLSEQFLLILSSSFKN